MKKSQKKFQIAVDRKEILRYNVTRWCRKAETKGFPGLRHMEEDL